MVFYNGRQKVQIELTSKIEVRHNSGWEITSEVEKVFLDSSAFEAIYPPVEKIPVITVDSFPQLGKLTALRFIEWTQRNPDGVISLPTGKTPEYFIKWVQYFTANWHLPVVAKQLEDYGIDTSVKPDLAGLSFVQIDEFYPIESSQQNSFNYYVNEYYVKGFGLSPANCLLIDCSQIGLSKREKLSQYWPDGRVDLSLRYRNPQSKLEEKQKGLIGRLDQWCMEYEAKIRRLGGIGFFLGGIGPDGHIGFNIKGSDHNSTTRLAHTNYPTQAAAATDLGGIEISRNRLVITIGLGTITYNPDCTAIIMAAGAAKASVVADAVQSEASVDVPAASLRGLKNARFYITHGAADGLTQRYLSSLKKQNKLCQEDAERIIISVSIAKNKPVSELTKEDFQHDDAGRVLLQKTSDEVLSQTRLNIISRIDRGVDTYDGKVFLHTEPHHDDLMLGCFPAIVRNIRKPGSRHNFVTLTSGFTSVTNDFMLARLEHLLQYAKTDIFRKLFADGYFATDNLVCRNRDVWLYLDGVAAADVEKKNEGRSRRLCRDLVEIYSISDISQVEPIVETLLKTIASHYPGQKDGGEIQKLKGMCREWESECLWGYYGWQCDAVHHLRLGFYTGDIFTQEPTYERDVQPVLKMLESVNPDIITVAFDPEASGPDTHYKVLQAIAEALKIYQNNTGKKDIQVWGYRNVWYRFQPWETNMYVPVSLNMFAVMQQAFESCFESQSKASFPSYEFDGQFSVLAQKIQVQQYQKLKSCLGRAWFNNHTSPLLRATRGFIYLKVMDVDELYSNCRRLKKQMEG